MKRPIFVAIIGYILGIIVGLYLHTSIVPFCICIVATPIIYKKITKKKKSNKLKLFSIKRYFRYIKIFINSKIIILIMVISIISNTLVLIQNSNYEKTYTQLASKKTIELTGTIISNKEEKTYYNKYKIETKIKNKKYGKKNRKCFKIY